MHVAAALRPHCYARRLASVGVTVFSRQGGSLHIPPRPHTLAGAPTALIVAERFCIPSGACVCT